MKAYSINPAIWRPLRSACNPFAGISLVTFWQVKHLKVGAESEGQLLPARQQGMGLPERWAPRAGPGCLTNWSRQSPPMVLTSKRQSTLSGATTSTAQWFKQLFLFSVSFSPKTLLKYSPFPLPDCCQHLPANPRLDFPLTAWQSSPASQEAFSDSTALLC